MSANFTPVGSVVIHNRQAIGSNEVFAYAMRASSSSATKHTRINGNRVTVGFDEAKKSPLLPPALAGFACNVRVPACERYGVTMYQLKYCGSLSLLMGRHTINAAK
jgi:hypothetical protein